MTRARRPWGGDAPQAALVLAGMAAFVAAVYITVVRGGGALLGRTDSPHLGLAVLATAVVAFGLEPVRRRLRPVAAKVARGERAAPYELLTGFRTEVTATYATDELPTRTAELLAAATGARYAQVWLSVDGRLVLAATASADEPAGPQSPEPAEGAEPPDPRDAGAAARGRRTLAVSHGDEPLGVLVVQERDGQPLTPVEEKLFTGLAAQAGLVLRLARLRAELAERLRQSSRRAEELRASRQRIVAAQDDERRRLERDIHDGAQQHLVALAVNLRLARTLITRSPERALPVLADLKTAAEETVATLSDLSRGIYPRQLTEAGLGVALKAAAGASALPVELSVADLARLPADVEAALYFCCLEAMQNAAKHAQATQVEVRVGPAPEGDDGGEDGGGGVELVISDDGCGFEPAAAAGNGGSGRGLANMRDRAESVSGALRLDSAPGRGTAVRVWVPAAQAPAQPPAPGPAGGGR